MATATLNNARTALFIDRDTEQLLKVQLVYIEDYNGVKVELAEAVEVYRSGQTDSAPAIKKVKELIRRKLAILEDINTIGHILDSRDGTQRF